jgi:hypothetical protein
MGLRHSVAILAILTAAAFVPARADAQSTTQRTVSRGDRTVIVTRDQDGRRRTKIVVNRRSFLDPGTKVFPGENRYDSGPALVWQPSFSGGSDRNTVFDRGQPPLPGRFELPFSSNPIERP